MGDVPLRRRRRAERLDIVDRMDPRDRGDVCPRSDVARQELIHFAFERPVDCANRSGRSGWPSPMSCARHAGWLMSSVVTLKSYLAESASPSARTLAPMAGKVHKSNSSPRERFRRARRTPRAGLGPRGETRRFAEDVKHPIASALPSRNAQLVATGRPQPRLRPRTRLDYKLERSNIVAVAPEARAAAPSGPRRERAGWDLADM